jgi:hypothetical protein
MAEVEENENVKNKNRKRSWLVLHRRSRSSPALQRNEMGKD